MNEYAETDLSREVLLNSWGIVALRKMGRCCVPGCRDNYDNGPEVHIFSFSSDDTRKKTWFKAVPRKYFTPVKHSKVSYPCCVARQVLMI